MMSDAIKSFHIQFEFEPRVENSPKKRKKYKTFVVCGMGGSHLAGDLLQVAYPEIDIVIHRNYGLPSLTQERWKKAFVIASSYSGNTEETINAYLEAVEKKLPVISLAVGGKLIELAKKNETPYIQMPNTGIQPRSALGYSMKAMMKAMRLEDGLKEVSYLSRTLNAEVLEPRGRELAQTLKNHVPVIYSSQKNRAIAYNWKIKFNETGKVPAFYNTFPELNHNEMTGFDAKDESRHLSKIFHFIILRDTHDHPRIQKRMNVLKKLYADRNLPVTILDFEGNSTLQRIFSSLVLADWTALYTAEMYGLESEQVPMVEEFKRLVV